MQYVFSINNSHFVTADTLETRRRETRVRCYHHLMEFSCHGIKVSTTVKFEAWKYRIQIRRLSSEGKKRIWLCRSNGKHSYLGTIPDFEVNAPPVNQIIL
jgi:hypothetical protein